MFNRLVSGSIFTQSNGIMGHNIDNSSLSQGRDTHGISHVVCEDEEGGAVWDEARQVLLDAIANGSHGMLSHTKSDIALCRRVLLEVSITLEESHVGGCQVSRSTNETREGFHKSIKINL